MLLGLCIVRLWLMPLGSSFWVDEMVTLLVVRLGPSHPSFSVAPQVVESVYYWLPRAATWLLGDSEVVLRLPSVLLLGTALFLIARLAARLIHPRAAWFAAFACLGLNGFNYQAADARPYALGACVAAASLFFLVRWLDSAGWTDALFFLVFAALVWRVHLVFWPFYPVIALYTAVRLARRDTPVGWARALAVFLLLGIVLLPVFAEALALNQEAREHVIVALPGFRELWNMFKLGLVVECGLGAWLLTRRFGWPGEPFSPASLSLILGWWLIYPLSLFSYSLLTGNSVFVSRYLSLELPGVALTATVTAAFFLPPVRWRFAAALLAAGVLLMLGQWHTFWPRHSNSDWREAVHRLNQFASGPDTPVICPSPFIEAQPPVWRPDYPLPGFLYAHLYAYPIRGRAYLFPFVNSPEAEQYAATLTRAILRTSGRFAIYGGDVNTHRWEKWFRTRPELAGWKEKRLGPFGDVDVVVFEKDDLSGSR